MPARYLHRLCLTLLLCCATAAHAAELALPLRLPVNLLQESLQGALGVKDNATSEVFRQGDCRYVQLEGFKLALGTQRIRVQTNTTIKFGPAWFGNCYDAVNFRGSAQFELEPYITEDHFLRYRLLDTQLVDEQGKKMLAAGLVWKLLAGIMQPKLEAYQIDLRLPRSELTGVLRNFASQSQVEELDRILASARIAPLQLRDSELQVPLILDIPDRYLGQPGGAVAASETPLSAEELASFERTSQAWDAFLVYIIRSLGLGIQDHDIRVRLLEILLNSRYQITAILSGETDESIGDPTRELFVATWNELHTLITDAGERGLLRGSLLTYLSFLSAGDALFLLDSTAPGLGMEISENGLRRLARAMRPLDKVDPLEFDWNLDPFLQELFDLEPAPVTPAPASQLPGWLNYLIAAAHAEAPDQDRQQLAERLRDWVPAETELDEYAQTVRALLDTTRVQLTESRYALAEQEVIQSLLPATAMIESCWRQYVRSGESVSYMRSPSGSIGMMQINPRVWRGIFDIKKLQNDAGYNVYAGTRILLLYLREHGRPIAARTQSMDDLARATYAAYNAGPRAAGRILKSSGKSRTQQIDAKFRDYYQALQAGGQVDLQSCRVVTPASG